MMVQMGIARPSAIPGPGDVPNRRLLNFARPTRSSTALKQINSETNKAKRSVSRGHGAAGTRRHPHRLHDHCRWRNAVKGHTSEARVFSEPALDTTAGPVARRRGAPVSGSGGPVARAARAPARRRTQRKYLASGAPGRPDALRRHTAHFLCACCRAIRCLRSRVRRCTYREQGCSRRRAEPGAGPALRSPSTGCAHLRGDMGKSFRRGEPIRGDLRRAPSPGDRADGRGLSRIIGSSGPDRRDSRTRGRTTPSAWWSRCSGASSFGRAHDRAVAGADLHPAAAADHRLPLGSVKNLR